MPDADRFPVESNVYWMPEGPNKSDPLALIHANGFPPVATGFTDGNAMLPASVTCPENTATLMLDPLESVSIESMLVICYVIMRNMVYVEILIDIN